MHAYIELHMGFWLAPSTHSYDVTTFVHTLIRGATKVMQVFAHCKVIKCIAHCYNGEHPYNCRHYIIFAEIPLCPTSTCVNNWIAVACCSIVSWPLSAKAKLKTVPDAVGCGIFAKEQLVLTKVRLTAVPKRSKEPFCERQLDRWLPDCSRLYTFLKSRKQNCNRTRLRFRTHGNPAPGSARKCYAMFLCTCNWDTSHIISHCHSFIPVKVINRLITHLMSASVFIELRSRTVHINIFFSSHHSPDSSWYSWNTIAFSQINIKHV